MPHAMLAFENFRFDPQAGALYEGDRLIPLTAKSAEVFALLLEEPGNVVTREEFFNRVWRGTFVEQRNLTQCIFLLRKALGDREGKRFIETAAKRGYRFAAPVEWVEVEGPGRPAERDEAGGGAKERYPNFWVVLSLFLLVGLLGVAWVVSERMRTVHAGRPLVRLTWSNSASNPDISLDGRFIVYIGEEEAGGLNALYRKDLSGGQVSRLTPPSATPLESPAISPDGKSVAFRTAAGDGEIEIVPADGSKPPRPLPDSQRGRGPRWQPGGNAIAYWTAMEEHALDYGAVQLQELTGQGKPIRLFDGFDTAFAPLWSPDGGAVLALGTAQSAISEREFDAWVNPFRGRVSTPHEIRTGLFDLLKSRGLYSTVRDRARITVTAWRGGYLYISIFTGHSADLYRVHIGNDFHVWGEPERLSSGTELLMAPRISASGLLVFNAANLTEQAWKMSSDGRRLGVLSASGGWLSRLSISGDEGQMAFEIYNPGRPVRVASMATPAGPQREVAGGSVAFPVVSRDGRQMAWRTMDGRKQAIEAAPLAGGPSLRVCIDCGAPEEWTPGSEALLYHTGSVPARIGLVDVSTGASRDWIAHPDFGVFGPRFSKDGAWVAFYQENTPRTRRIFVARVKPGWETILPQDWIPVTSGASWDSAPVWSENGRALHFVSQRDGYRCIYSQRLDPSSKQPVGPSEAIRHFHSASLLLAGFNRARGAESLRQAGGNLYFILDQMSSNIWSLQVPD